MNKKQNNSKGSPIVRHVYIEPRYNREFFGNKLKSNVVLAVITEIEDAGYCLMGLASINGEPGALVCSENNFSSYGLWTLCLDYEERPESHCIHCFITHDKDRGGHYIYDQVNHLIVNTPFGSYDEAQKILNAI